VASVNTAVSLSNSPENAMSESFFFDVSSIVLMICEVASRLFVVDKFGDSGV